MSIKKMLMIFGAAIGVMVLLMVGSILLGSGSVSEAEATNYYTEFSTTYSYTTTSDPVQFGTALVQLDSDYGIPTDKDIINQTLATYDGVFYEIEPQLQADEVYTLLLFSNDLNNYKSGKNENALYRKDAALSIIEKYGIIKYDENGNVIANTTTSKPEDTAATTVDEEGNTVPVTEDAVLASDLSKITTDDTIYSNIITTIENNAGLNMVDDSDLIWEETTGISTLSLGTGYPPLEINGVRACYQYTGNDANLEFTVADKDASNSGEYAVYDDYSDCLRNNKSISREFTNGYSTDENNNKGQADGYIDAPEVSETVLVKNGQYVNMYNTTANMKNEISAVES